MRTYWLSTAFLLSLLIAGLQQWAVSSSLYWRYVWFDAPMHLLGGLTVGVFLVTLLRSYHPFLFIAGIAAIIVGWEVFEFAIGVPRETNYVFDTSLDILLGTCGAAIAYIIARYTLWRSP